MKGDKVACQVYAVFHLQQVQQVFGDMSGTKTVVADIKAPVKQHYRLEVLLWGYRNVTSPDWRMLARRGIIIRFAGRDIKHTFLQPQILENFSSQDIRTLDVVLPQDKFPVLRITLKDMYTLFLSTFRQHTVENMKDYEVVLVSREQYESAIRGPFLFSVVPESFSVVPEPEPALAAMAGVPAVETDTAVVEEEQPKRATSLKQLCTRESVLCLPVRRFLSAVGRIRERRQQLTPDERQDDRDFTEIEARFDWWTKYFGTLAAMQEASGSLLPGTEEELFVQLKLKMIKIYFAELEKQPQFKGFFDCVRTFPLFREGHINGQFKGGLKLYQLPVEGMLMPDGSLPGTGYPSNEPLEIVVRLYVVRGIGLAIRDVTGASDPYLVVSTSSRENLVNDRENYIPATLDPIFGRMFELELSLPDDYQLNITVMDRDIKWDDLIGTTTIDIENRYYSKFRATRGISNIYKEDGYRKWRDCDKPTAILASLCEGHNIPGPVYTTDNVILGSWDGEVGGEPDPIKKEELALSALNQWETLPYVGYQLVPEHVESRLLYDPNRVGETQLWVDIFDKTEELPPPVNIVPRYPDPYELRVTVWDTRDVLLRDYSILTGQRSSDIYVRGWLCSEKIVQETDIHYRSLTGEGNFNYRLIFRFDFWSAEGKISLPGKHVDDTNKQPHKPATKCPCVLIVEVWDNNHLYRDEEIGILKLNLMRLPQGANTSRSCTLETLGPKTRTSDLFKQRRTRGWWPFQAGSEEGPKLTGKIDMELELLTKEDAEKYPAGHGRSAPNPLDKPMRPETSFDWLRHPLKALYYSIWLEYRTKVLKLIIYAFITYIVFRFVLTLPDIITNTIAKKVSGC
ncbi:fer-1-like protein 6 isoform X2 [Bacillus rossius redtenbacheri]|uniref:fer-1-like protein 6 isoform X2 n=1 Tax=Bacillus rossius redtenbacheri TaxID=93214 RepID=UPI002FDD8AE4